MDRNLLSELVLLAENLSEAEGYLARANFKLAQIYTTLGNKERGRVCMEAAEAMRLKLSPNEKYIDDLEESYNKLVLWMLW